MKNGKQIGQDHLATLDAYFAKGGAVPVSAKDGALNLAELSRTTGIPKSSFYQNPKVKERLEAARQQVGVERQGERRQPKAEGDTTALSPVAPSGASTAAAQLERRLHRLEQQNGALVAENFELRRQVKELRLQLGREDMMIETGRRVAMPPAEA